MNSQTPGADAPEPTDTEPTTPAVPPALPPEPDAKTTRVPVGSPDDPLPPPVVPPSPPPAGLISANPVGWTGPDQASPSGSVPGGPEVSWAPPAGPVAAQVVAGFVIAGTFSRLVAYAIDTLFLATLNLVALGLLGQYTTDRDSSLDLVVSGALVVVDFIYFVGFWTSAWRATLGMRLIGLRVLGAATGANLSFNDALLRWIALSGAVAILAVVPRVAGTLGLLSALWVLVLLITTATHPLRQGLHDRWARSIVVQRSPGGSGAAIAGCLVIVVLLFFVLPLAVIAFAAPQLEDLMRQMGESV